MDYHANGNKPVLVQIEGEYYVRDVIQTHFVTVGESYVTLVRRYVLPRYRPGDILSVSEKVIALCQGRIVTENEVKPGFWAHVLARFVHQTAAGPGMGLPVKMQFAIRQCGLMKVLWAAVRAGWDKLRGVKGTFYRLLGPEVSGLDGFYGHDIPLYAHMGIRIPDHPHQVCDEIFQKTGVVSMIVDANDLNVELLGRARQLKSIPVSLLLDPIRDNPAGQGRQCTPFVLIRRVSRGEALAAAENRIQVKEVDLEKKITE